MNNRANHLDLMAAPQIIFFYGLAGVGKSYVGDLVGELSGRYVYHADQDITDDMNQAISDDRPFTGDMRDDYFSIISEKIIDLKKAHSQLIVTQATYKQKHRDFLNSIIPNMDLIWVTADIDIIKQRLVKRNNNVTLTAANRLLQDFEAPSHKAKVIANEGDDNFIINQMNDLYGKLKSES